MSKPKAKSQGGEKKAAAKGGGAAAPKAAAPKVSALRAKLAQVDEETLAGMVAYLPDVQEMAQTLGVDLEEYVGRLVYFLKHPDEEPVLALVDEKELKAAGLQAPSVDEVRAWFEKVNSGEIVVGVDLEKSGYQKREKDKVAMPSEHTSGKMYEGDEDTVSALKQQLSKQLKGKGGKV